MKCYNILNAVKHCKINTINVAYKYYARKEVLWDIYLVLPFVAEMHFSPSKLFSQQ